MVSASETDAGSKPPTRLVSPAPLSRVEGGRALLGADERRDENGVQKKGRSEKC